MLAAGVMLLILSAGGCEQAASPTSPPSADPQPSAPAVSPQAARIPSAGEIAQLPVPVAGEGPEVVIRRVVEALRDNDKPFANAGIATAFNFASPANKAVTGPLERFIPMVWSENYAPLIGHASAEYSPVVVEGDQAEQLVTLLTPDGRTVWFVFTLGLQKVGDHAGCWMTEGVSPVVPVDAQPDRPVAPEPETLRI